MFPVHVLEEVDGGRLQTTHGLVAQVLGRTEGFAGSPSGGPRRLGTGLLGTLDRRTGCVRRRGWAGADWAVRLFGEQRVELQVDSPLAERVRRGEAKVEGLHETEEVADGCALVIFELGEDLLDLGAVEHPNNARHRLDRRLGG